MLKTKLKPKQAARLNALVNKGLSEYKSGNFRLAASYLQEAVSSGEQFARIWPNFQPALNYLVLSLTKSGDIFTALQRQAELVELMPKNQQNKVNLLLMLRMAGTKLPNSRIFQAAILKAAESINPEGYAVELATCLCADPGFLSAMQTISQTEEFFLPAAILEDSYAGLLKNPLLLRLMQSTIIPIPNFEHLFRKLRKAFLQASSLTLADEPKDFQRYHNEFLANLALYAWLTEYAMFIDAEETAHLQEIASKISASLDNFTVLHIPLLQDLLLFALYQPLYQLPATEKLLDIPVENWPSHMKYLLQEWRNYRIEQNLKPKILALTAINDDISAQVREQYEANPYPRWKHPPAPGAKISLADLITQMSPTAIFPARFRDPVDVLIAGCGTGYLVCKIASDIDLASLLAIDLSLSSLSYASRMANTLENALSIEFRQADILQLTHLEQSFDFIICTGVLHHLHEPMTGWRILNSLLRPGGLMYIGLYSELARLPLMTVRNLIHSRSLQPSPETMRLLRMEILEGKHPELQVLLNWQDFYSLSMFRDMAFHVKEHLFTLPKIKSSLAELGLDFLYMAGLALETLHAYSRMFPNDPSATSLDNWAIFEQQNPLTFLCMYNFYAIKKSIDH